MFRSPSLAGLPHLKTMLDDLPTNHKQVARHLGITLQTLNKYIKAEGAPRAIMLALFWETRWGRSAANSEAANWAALCYRQVQGLENQIEILRKQITLLETEENRFGAANSSIFNIGQLAVARPKVQDERLQALKPYAFQRYLKSTTA